MYANAVEDAELIVDVDLEATDEEFDALSSLTNVKVKEPLTNNQNLSYIGELYIGTGD